MTATDKQHVVASLIIARSSKLDYYDVVNVPVFATLFYSYCKM